MMTILCVSFQVLLKLILPKAPFSAGNATFCHITWMFWNGGWGNPLQSSWAKIVLPKHECPVTIFTIDTIGTLKSRRLLWVLLDSSLMMSMIKGSAFLPKVAIKTIRATKNIATIAGKIQVREAVTIGYLRLPEFDSNQHINQQKALVSDNDTVKYDIFWGRVSS